MIHFQAVFTFSSPWDCAASKDVGGIEQHAATWATPWLSMPLHPCNQGTPERLSGIKHLFMGLPETAQERPVPY